MRPDPTEAPEPSDAPDMNDAPPRKRPLWRRLLKWGLVTFGVLLLLVLLTVVFFHLPPGKAIVRGVVEDGLAERYNGEVTLGELDYALFGDVAIADLHVRDPSGATALHLGRLDLELDWGALLGGRLVIDRLAIDGVDFDSAAMQAAQKEPFKLPQGDGLTVHALDIQRVNATLTRPDGTVVRLTDLTVAGSLATDNRERSADVDISRFAVNVDVTRPDGTRLTLPLATGLTLTRRGDDLRLTTRELNATARVERPGEAPIDAPLRVGALNVTARPGLVQAVFDGLTAGPLALERLAADLRLTAAGAPVGAQRLEVTGLTVSAADANALLGRELLLSDLRADLGVAGPPNALAVTGDVVTDGATLALRGTVDASDPAKPAFDLRFTGDDVDTAKLLAGDRPPLTTSLVATLSGRVTGPGAVDADVHLELGPTRVGDRGVDSVTLDATARGEVLTLTGLKVAALGQELLVTGSLDRGTRRFEGRAQSGVGLGGLLAEARDAGLLIVPLPAIAGTLDVDLALAGVLAPEGATAAEAASPSDSALPLDRLPVESLTLKGHAHVEDVEVSRPEGPLKVASARLEADLAVADAKPTGTLTVRVVDLDAGRTALERVDVDVAVDGLSQRTTVVVRDAPSRLSADLALATVLDPATRSATVTVERLEVERGAFATRLLEPVTAHLAPPDPDGTLTLALPTMRLAAAGGEVSLGVRARFVPDPDNPGANLLQHATGSLELDGLSLGQLAALARRSTRGVSGTLSGSFGFDGTPADPSATFGLTLRARARGASPALVRVVGSVRDARLGADVRVTDAGSKALLARLEVAAPLSLGPGKPPGLAPGGRLAVTLDVPRRRLGAFGALLPGGLPPTVDPDAELSASASLTGTPGRPTGRFQLDLAGALVPDAAERGLPARQRLAVRADLAPAGGAVALTSRLEAWLDAAGAPLATITTEGRFTRSPLLARATARPWQVTTTLAPIDLAAVPLPRPATGTIEGSLALEGVGSDLLGKLGFVARAVKVGDAPAVTSTTTLDLERDATRVDVRARAGDLDVLTIAGTVGVAGSGLLRTLRRRGALADAPLDLSVTVPKRSLAAWSALAPRPIALPGDAGGVIAVTGTLKTPLARGELGWDGFTTLAGTPGRVALTLDATAERVGGALEVGPGRGDQALVRASAGVARAELMAPTGPLAVDVSVRAADADVLALVPDAVVGGARLDVAGRLDSDLAARVVIARDAEGARLDPAASDLGGALVLREGRVAVPGSERVLQDLRARLGITPEAVDLTFAVREADAQNDRRTAKATARVALVELMPTKATLKIETERFLVLGRAFDGPEGELDLTLNVTATRLLEPIKDVEVVVERVVLDAPERFVRAHYQQFTSYGDVIYLDETGLASGKLQPPPAPPSSATDAPALDADAPETGFDVRLRIPEPLDVHMDPLTLAVRGGMDVKMRRSGLTLAGRIDVTDGAINVMGWQWPLVRGAVTADGGLDTFLAEMTFSRAPHAAALRDAAVEEAAHEGRTFITIRIDMANGQQVSFGGVAGPYLLDVATMLNTGRHLVWTRADLPATDNVQFGTIEQGLVNTFVQTNLRNLIFMDRANGWSDPTDDRGEYGRVWNYRAERYLSDDSARLRLVTRAPTIGQNRAEIAYDLLFSTTPRSVVGAGAHFGSDLRLGLGLFWEFWSRD